METPKLSAIVAPMTANVSDAVSSPLPSKDGEYAINGTLSLVWSVPVCAGSFPWSAVNISRSSHHSQSICNGIDQDNSNHRPGKNASLASEKADAAQYCRRDDIKLIPLGKVAGESSNLPR